MTEEVSAGRLHVDAYADTSGFGRDAKAKIEAATKDLRAKIKVELDDRGLITQARATAKKAQEAAKVRLQAVIDSRGLQQQAKDEAAKASKAARVKIGAELDQAKFQRDLAAAVAATNNRYSVSVNVDVDTAAAQAKMQAFRQGQKRLPIDLGAKINVGNLGQVISQFSKFPALAGGIFLLGAALGQVVGGLFAIVSSASQAVVALAALPNLLGAIGQGAAALLIGFSGIGDAVGELGKAEASSAQQSAQASKTRVSAAKAVEDSARRVADAQRALKEAHHQAADAARQAGYAVSDAEWNLARAQESAKEAQEGVNEARKVARERIDELNESLKQVALAEENAANKLVKARQALQDVRWDPAATAQEERDAVLAVKNAEQELADTKDQHKDLAKETQKANKEGVKGSEEVQDAQENLRDANHSLMLAERQMFEARHSAADTAAANARMIADAQRAIRDAQEGNAAAIQAQNDALGGQTAALADQLSAFNKLSPAAQKFALFLFNTVIPRFRQLRDAVQAAILPPLQTGITKAMPLIDTLQTGLVGSARVVGRLAIRVGELFGSKGFNRDTAAIMSSNNRALENLGHAGINLIRVLSRIAKAAGPTLVEPFAKWLRQLTATWRKALQGEGAMKRLEDRFIRARKTVRLLADIFSNIGGTLHEMGKAATPAGDRLLKTFERVTQKWQDWAESDEGQRRVQEFMEAIEPGFRELADLIANLSVLLMRMAEHGGGPLVGFLGALNFAIRGLNAVLATPYLGSLIGWLLTIAGVGGAVGLLSGAMLGLSRGIRLLFRITGLTALFNAFKMSVLGTRIGLALLWVQQKLVAAGQAVLRGALMATRFAMLLMGKAAKLMLGPWGLAILAVVGLFVLLYKKVGWFRDAVQWVMDKVVDAFNWVVDGARALWDALFGNSIFPDIADGLQWFADFVGGIFDTIGDAVKWIIGFIKSHWDKLLPIFFGPFGLLLVLLIKNFGLIKQAVSVAMAGIRVAIQVAWRVVRVIFGLFRTGIRALGVVFRWLHKKIVVPVWRLIEKAIGVAWRGIKVYFRLARVALDVLGAVFSWLWKKIVVPVWRGIQKIIEHVWNRSIKPNFRLLGKALDVLGAWFTWLWKKIVVPTWRGIQRSIDVVWGFLRDKVFEPLEKMVKTTIPNAFTKAKTAIKSIWDKLKGIAAAPVRFVVNTVYSDGIRKVVNAIPGVPNLDPISFNYARGTSSILPGYTPGKDPYNFVSDDGRMALNLSGGEGIVRPEVVRTLGPKMIEAMNAAAAQGGSALTRLLSGGGHNPIRRGAQAGFSRGGVLGGIRKTLSFFLGGVMPLQATRSVSRHSVADYPFATWAGDLNGDLDTASPPGAVYAWKPGKVARTVSMTTSYGKHVYVNHGGQASLYAHLSSIIARVGQSLGAGQILGRVGSTGNSTGPHLHFEVRGGSVSGGTGVTGGGKSPGQIKAEKKEEGWRSAISTIKDALTAIPRWMSKLANIEGWGETLRKGVSSIGGDVIQWVNDKIPNEIPVPKLPNIPLPDNPIPNPFDDGGDWRSGTLGVNMSGGTETVFTNENIVDITGDLARIANGLRAQTVDSANGGGPAALVGELTLNARPDDDVTPLLGEMQHVLRVLSLGGVHVDRIA